MRAASAYHSAVRWSALSQRLGRREINSQRADVGGGARHRTPCDAEGVDEEEAINAVCELIACGFGEAEPESEYANQSAMKEVWGTA